MYTLSDRRFPDVGKGLSLRMWGWHVCPEGMCLSILYVDCSVSKSLQPCLHTESLWVLSLVCRWWAWLQWVSRRFPCKQHA